MDRGSKSNAQLAGKAWKYDMKQVKPTAAEDADTTAVEDGTRSAKTVPLADAKIGKMDTKSFRVDEWGARQEDALIFCIKSLLTLGGADYSEAAIRDLPDTPGENFTPKSAVSALKNAGFTASFGPLNPSEIVSGHCPAIGFDTKGQAKIVMSVSEDGQYISLRETADGTVSERKVDRGAFEAEMAPFVILMKTEHPSKRIQRKNDWLWSSLAQSRWVYGQVILAALLSNMLLLATPIFMMTVYDRIVPNQATDSLIVLTIGALLALGFDFTLKLLKAKFIDRASRKADGRMARLIFDKILDLPLDQKRQNAGAMGSIVREFDTLREFFTSATLVAVVDLPFVFLFIAVIYMISGPLAVVPLIMIPLVITTTLIVQPLMARISEGAMKSNMSKQGVLIETLNGLETIKATGSGRLMRNRFEAASDVQSELGLETRTLSQFAINATAGIIQLNMVLTIFYGVFLLQDGVITMGAMIATVVLGSRALTPLSQLTAAMTRANSARQAYRSISEVMNSGSLSDQHAGSDAPRLSRPRLNGEIELRNVTYTFPGSREPTIRQLNLKIEAGQKVAVLGRMGSGKSTLVRLLSGLIEPSSGSILIDGVDIRQLDKSDLRRNVGVMLQENWLFSGTVKDNLRMGFFEYDDAHILEIAKASGVDDFVGQHAEGYDLELRERGEGLSGGQRQSINLARSLLHNPPVIVLDEPTSAMDNNTERSVMARLAGHASDKTMVIVTHRNTLLDMVDRVLIFENGVIKADTTPAKMRELAAVKS